MSAEAPTAGATGTTGTLDPGDPARPPTSGLRLADFFIVAKPGVSIMVVLSALAGYVMAAGRVIEPGHLLLTLLGTALAAGGAAALNQVVEYQLDAKMKRTMFRPVAVGRLSPDLGLAAGVILTCLGLATLVLQGDLLAGVVCAATTASYVFVYTPLKTRTSLCTVIGAVPGALPPLIGWAAAQHALPAPAWVLFSILFFWQIPHFLAIAWKYREDYARGGFLMLPVIEPGGGSTGRQAVVYAAGLLVASLMPLPMGMAGPVYFVGAFLAGALFFAAAVRFAILRTDRSARSLFLGSLAYLPVVLGLLVFDRVG